ncbi:MAG: hypothetical protein CMO60_00320 [Verrucomicrobiales bacterium]|nr:hypothetical protein [Verrucomicrobiales bacterium]
MTEIKKTHILLSLIKVSLLCTIGLGLAACTSQKDRCLTQMDTPSCGAMCTAGEMAACNQLAQSLTQSVTSQVSKTEIKSLFETACLGGHGAACDNRGNLCDTTGHHDAKAKARPGIVCARKWYGLACQHGWKAGCSKAKTMNQAAFGR